MTSGRRSGAFAAAAGCCLLVFDLDFEYSAQKLGGSVRLPTSAALLGRSLISTPCPDISFATSLPASGLAVGRRCPYSSTVLADSCTKLRRLGTSECVWRASPYKSLERSKS